MGPVRWSLQANPADHDDNPFNCQRHKIVRPLRVALILNFTSLKNAQFKFQEKNFFF